MVKIKVSDHFQRCGVREKGKKFYQQVLELVPKGEKNIQFDFKEVTFVSASFLEESIFRLIDDYNVSILDRSEALERKAERIIDWKKLNVRLIFDHNTLHFISP